MDCLPETRRKWLLREVSPIWTEPGNYFLLFSFLMLLQNNIDFRDGKRRKALPVKYHDKVKKNLFLRLAASLHV